MLRDKIKSESRAALLGRDQKKLDVLRYLLSLLDKRQLQLPPGKMDEREEVAVLQKELKNKEESKLMFTRGGREDLVAQTEYEIGILKAYLPAAMPKEEVEKLVDEVIAKGGNDFGMVMKEVMAAVAGRAGGDVVSALVREKLKG